MGQQAIEKSFKGFQKAYPYAGYYLEGAMKEYKEFAESSTILQDYSDKIKKKYNPLKRARRAIKKQRLDIFELSAYCKYLKSVSKFCSEVGEQDEYRKYDREFQQCQAEMTSLVFAA